VLITEKDLSAESLAGTIVALVGDRARLVEMGQKARALARPDAARDLARLLFEAEATR
jgi:UDP-N-acetylglucosamine--N-acetylmuramyl-(pentapeptide) pyrophosphoryl-undecaprenol N-acetylglucosamine transferase